jgi:hypothetical protein
MNWLFYENVMRWPETKFTLYQDEQGVLQQPAPPHLFRRCGRTPLTAVFAFPSSHWKSSSLSSAYDFSSFSSSQRILTRITCEICSQWLITRFIDSSQIGHLPSPRLEIGSIFAATALLAAAAV